MGRKGQAVRTKTAELVGGREAFQVFECGETACTEDINSEGGREIVRDNATRVLQREKDGR